LSISSQNGIELTPLLKSRGRFYWLIHLLMD
jgi:hypothetical protein